MKCSCPKCNSQIEFDLVDIPSEGSYNKCAECSASLVISKESFARRALHKSDEISCAECGSHPGTSIYCQNCHAIYPDFLLVSTSSAAKKQLGKILDIFSRFNRISVRTPAKTQYRDSGIPSTSKAKGLSLPSQPAQLAAILAAITVISVGGGYYWFVERAATAYSENYVRALLFIKSARDLEMKISSRLSNDLKNGPSASLTVAEKKSATSAKNDVEIIMKRIGKAPDKFSASKDTLIKLEESYLNLHSTVVSPAGTSDMYTSNVKKMDDNFIQNARTLQAGLPEKISGRLAESRKKYKSLKDF